MSVDPIVSSATRFITAGLEVAASIILIWERQRRCAILSARLRF